MDNFLQLYFVCTSFPGLEFSSALKIVSVNVNVMQILRIQWDRSIERGSGNEASTAGFHC